jgi:hypothetical protein
MLVYVKEEKLNAKLYSPPCQKNLLENYSNRST